jgi:tRNA isopentenyl-2-thiomethyl-A-37 hydroxylase MiaE
MWEINESYLKVLESLAKSYTQHLNLALTYGKEKVNRAIDRTYGMATSYLQR